MKPLVFVAILAAMASADPNNGSHWNPDGNPTDVWIDIAAGFERVAPGNGVTYTAELIRFAPSVDLGHHLYLGAGFTAGRISGVSGVRPSEVTCPDGLSGEACDQLQSSSIDDPHGDILSPQVFLGARLATSIYAGSFELAPTQRFTNGDFTLSGQSRNLSETILEAHARFDVWFTPYTTAGVFVGADTGSIHDFQTAVQIGVHFYPTHGH